MALTREDIEQRVAKLRSDKEQAQAQVIAVDGALQDAEWFLAKYDEVQEAGEQAPAPAPTELESKRKRARDSG